MLAAGMIPGVVYLLTMLPDTSFGDWAEMQTVPPVAGIAHPTGYPLYTMLGWLWSNVPLGSVAWRMNLSSAVATIITIVVTFLILRRLEVRPWIASAASMTFGFVLTVWLASTRAEVHTLHALFVALLIHRMLVWTQEGRSRDLYLGASLIGLSFTHHLLTVTIVPFVVVFALVSRWRTLVAHPGWIGIALGCAIVPLIVFAYLPIRAAMDPPLEYGDVSNWSSLVAHVAGEQFRSTFGFLSAEGLDKAIGELPDLGGHLVSLGTVPLVVLAVFGWLGLVRGRPGFAAFVACLLAANAYIYTTYIAADLPRYLLVSWLALIVLFGRGAEVVARRVNRGGAVSLAIFVVPLILLGANYGATATVGDRDGRRFATELFERLPRDAALITYWDVANPLWHRQLIHAERLDVLVLDDTNLVFDGWAGMSGAVVRLVGERPTYLLRMFDDGIDEVSAAYDVSEEGLVRVPYGQPYVEWDRPLLRVSTDD